MIWIIRPIYTMRPALYRHEFCILTKNTGCVGPSLVAIHFSQPSSFSNLIQLKKKKNYWDITDLQYCIHFGCTAKLIYYTKT